MGFFFRSVPLLENTTMGAHKSFRTKTKLARKMKQNRPIPQWVRMKTADTMPRGVTGGVRSSRCKLLTRGPGNGRQLGELSSSHPHPKTVEIMRGVQLSS